MATELEQLQQLEEELAQQAPQKSELDQLRELEASLEDSGLVKGAKNFGRGARKALLAKMEPGRTSLTGLGEMVGYYPPGTLEAEKKQFREKIKETRGIDIHAPPTSYPEAFGEATPGALAAGLAFAAGGPALAGVSGTGRVATLLRGIGEVTARQPIGTVAGAVAGVPGAVIGGEYGAAGGEALGEVIGGETGRKVGGAVGGVTGTVLGGTITGAPGQRVASLLTGERAALKASAVGPRPTTSLLEESASVESPRQYAFNQVEGIAQRLDARINHVVDTMANARLTPEGVSRGFVRRLELLERQQNNVVDQAWAAVPRGAPVEVDNALTAANGMIPLLDTNPATVPAQAIQRLNNLGTLTVVTPTGERVVNRPIPLGRLLELRSSILHDMRVAQSGSATTAPNDGLYRNLAILNDNILDSITATPALRGNIAVQQANDITRIFHDRFDRSVIADILGAYRSGTNRVQADQAIQYLLKQHRGPTAVYEAGAPLSPGSAIPAAQREPAMARGVRESVDEGVLQEYRDVAQQVREQTARLNPEKAARQAGAAGIAFGDKMLPQMTDYARASSRIATSTAELASNVRQLDAIEKSALNRFAKQGTPEQAIRHLLDSSAIPPGGRFTPIQEVMREVRRDPDAHTGMKTLIIDQLRREGGTSMAKTRQLWQSERFQRAARQIFSPDEQNRINNLTRLLEGAERGDRTALQRISRTSLEALAVWAGVHFGGAVAGVTAVGAAGYGRLAFPAAFKRLFQNKVQKSFEVEGGDVLFSKALYDPKYEAQMLRKLPTVWQEAASFNNRIHAFNRSVSLVASGAGTQSDETQ